MDNKYNKLMDHIEVTDEMRDRILLNISKADIKPRQAGVKAISGAKRAKISRIIGIAAAAGIVLSVGGIILFILSPVRQTTRLKGLTLWKMISFPGIVIRAHAVLLLLRRLRLRLMDLNRQTLNNKLCLSTVQASPKVL